MITLYYFICSYNKILNKNPSNLQLFGAALSDIIITLLISYILYLIINIYYKINYLIIFLILLVFGIYLQKYLCTKNIIKYIEKNNNIILDYIINKN